RGQTGPNDRGATPCSRSSSSQRWRRSAGPRSPLRSGSRPSRSSYGWRSSPRTPPPRSRWSTYSVRSSPASRSSRPPRPARSNTAPLPRSTNRAGCGPRARFFSETRSSSRPGAKSQTRSARDAAKKRRARNPADPTPPKARDSPGLAGY
ncbi:hypothetical protein M885DRAFT_626137, partial [Pelagophyceae sp. CCMP2097]